VNYIKMESVAAADGQLLMTPLLSRTDCFVRASFPRVLAARS